MIEHSAFDVTIATANTMQGAPGDLPLRAAVAAGRLFLLNANGEYEQVLYASYWRNGDLYGAHVGIGEIDEDGNTTWELT